MSKPSSEHLAPITYHIRLVSHSPVEFKYSWIVIDKRNGSVLCQCSRTEFGGGIKHSIHLPIEWNNYPSCVEWIEKGCIAEIQEDMSNLNVGFFNNFVKVEE